MITVLAVFIFFVVMFLLASILYQQIGSFKWFFHDVLGWHMPNNFYVFDGVNLSSRCKYCGKEIMRKGLKELVLKGGYYAERTEGTGGNTSIVWIPSGIYTQIETRTRGSHSKRAWALFLLIFKEDL